MQYALINKWNHVVREVVAESPTTTGGEDYYVVATEFSFQTPSAPDIYRYQENEFALIANHIIETVDARWQVDRMFSDYKSTRVALYVLMMQKGGFSNLTLIEKQIMSKWFLVGRTERNSVHTTEEQIENGLAYNENSIQARKARLTKCMMEVYNRLDDDQIKSVMAIMDFSRTTYAYVEVGQEGTLEGNSEGLYDYIDARAGTAWETTGLRAQAYTPVGYANCGLLADRLLDILANGNY